MFSLSYSFFFFFFYDTSPSEIYTLSLHDALPIFRPHRPLLDRAQRGNLQLSRAARRPGARRRRFQDGHRHRDHRSEEHTSELQSRFDLVCRLLLEKKKKKNRKKTQTVRRK